MIKNKNLKKQKEQLLKDLQSTHAEVREKAALGLGYLGDHHMIEPLSIAANDKDASVRLAAIHGLVQLHHADTLPVLINALMDDFQDIRRLAQRALPEFQEKGVEALLTVLQDEDWMRQKTALEMLAEFKGTSLYTHLEPFLQSDDWYLRETAVKTLGKLQEPDSTQVLIRLVRDEDRDVRKAAVQALGYIHTPEVIETLLQVLLIEPEKYVRRTIGEALSQQGTQAVQPIIRCTLFNHQSEVREVAAMALGELGDEQAKSALIILLEDPVLAVRQAAALALSKIDPSSSLWGLLHDFFQDNLELRIRAARFIGELNDTRAMPIMLKALEDKNPDIREAVTLAMGHLREPEILNALITMLQDVDPRVRRAAAGSLGALRNRQAVLPLVQLLGDPDPLIRIEVENSLLHIEPESPVWLHLYNLRHENPSVRKQAIGFLSQKEFVHISQALICHLKEDLDPDVRSELAIALGAIQSIASIPYLCQILTHNDESLQVREQAALALGEIGDPQGFSALLNMTRSKHQRIREAVIQSIVKIPISDIQALFDMLEDDTWFVRETVIQILGQIQHKEAIPHLIQALQDRDRDVRRAAVEALGNLRVSEAVDPLIDALENGFRDVRSAAAKALGQLEDPWAIGPLCESVEEDEDSLVREYAANALGKLKNKQALDILPEVLLHDEEQSVRAACAQALGEIGGDLAVDVLLNALDDNALDVVQSVIQALGHLANERAIPALLTALNQGNSEIRGTAALALQHFHQDQVREALEQTVLSDEYREVKRFAMSSLGTWAADDFEQFMDHHWQDMSETIQLEVMEVLKKHPKAGEALLKKALDSENIDLQMAAMDTLKLRPLPAFQDRLARLLHNAHSERFQIKVIEALAQIDSPKILPIFGRFLNETDSPLIQEELIKNMASFGTHAIQYLNDALFSWEPQIKDWAARALAEMGQIALPHLINALENKDRFLRLAVIKALGKLKDDSALQAMVALLDEPDMELCIAVFDSLRVFGEAAHPYLFEALTHTVREVRFYAAQALNRMVPNEPLWSILLDLNSPFAPQRKMGILALRDATDDIATPSLMLALEDEDMDMRKGVIEALVHRQVQEIVPQLKKYLHYWNKELRCVSIRSLGKLGVDELDELNSQFQDEDPDITNEVLKAYAQLQLPQKIVPALAHKYDSVRQNAIELLGQLGYAEVSTQIVDILAQEQSLAIRLSAIQALGQLGDHQAIPVLLDIFKNKEKGLYTVTLQALKALQAEDVIPIILDIFKHEDAYWLDIDFQMEAVKTMGRFKAKQALSFLINMYRIPSWGDPELKRTALEALGELEPPEYRELLNLAMVSPHKPLAEYASKEWLKRGYDDRLIPREYAEEVPAENPSQPTEKLETAPEKAKPSEMPPEEEEEEEETVKATSHQALYQYVDSSDDDDDDYDDEYDF